MTTQFTLFTEEWLAALESGDYKQAQGMLRDLHDRRCCLGVACEVHDPRLWVEIGTDSSSPQFEYMNTATRLPAEVQSKLNFSDVSGDFVITDDFLARLSEDLAKRVQAVSENTCQNMASSEDYGEDEEYPDGLCSLADLNDSGFTFPEIATVVRARPQGLFVEN